MTRGNRIPPPNTVRRLSLVSQLANKAKCDCQSVKRQRVTSWRVINPPEASLRRVCSTKISASAMHAMGCKSKVTKDCDSLSLESSRDGDEMLLVDVRQHGILIVPQLWQDAHAGAHAVVRVLVRTSSLSVSVIQDSIHVSSAFATRTFVKED